MFAGDHPMAPRPCEEPASHRRAIVPACRTASARTSTLPQGPQQTPDPRPRHFLATSKITIRPSSATSPTRMSSTCSARPIKRRRESWRHSRRAARHGTRRAGARGDRARSKFICRPQVSDDEIRAAVRAAIAGGAGEHRRGDGQGGPAVQGPRGGEHDQSDCPRGAGPPGA